MLTVIRCAFLQRLYALNRAPPLRNWRRRGVGRCRCCDTRRGTMGQHTRVFRYEVLPVARL
jgi:hypothetical protein